MFCLGVFVYGVFGKGVLSRGLCPGVFVRGVFVLEPVRKEGRSHGVSVKHNLHVVRWKNEKNILLENFNNCYIMLLIHLMKII